MHRSKMPPEARFDVADAYKQHREDVRNFLLSISASSDVAEEICQEVFLAAHKYAHTYDSSKGELKTWLYSIARNLFYRYSKKKKDSPEPLEEVADFRPSTEAQVDEKFLSTTLRDAVDRLPEPARTIVQMKYFKQSTLKECAEKLGLPISTASRRLIEAMIVLRRELGDAGIGI